MKTIISKVLIILLMLNLIAPFSVYATENISIYNCGEQIRLRKGLAEYYGRNYIHENDLKYLNLDIYEDVISNAEEDVIMQLFPGSSIVIVNDISITFPKAVVEEGEIIYISLDLIAMFFSEEYEITESGIYLWISDSSYDYVRGFISLPSGEVAPEGGIDIEVFVADSSSIPSTGGSGSNIVNTYYSEIGVPGYTKGEYKPMYDTGVKNNNAFLSYKRIVSKSISIPEGQNSVEYTLSAYGEDLYKCLVGYYAEINGKPYYDKQKYIGNSSMYNFELSSGANPLINGTISIPDIAEKDIEYRVIASGKSYDFICDGIILEGEKTGTYSVAVDKNATYSIEVIFIDGEYLRTTVEEDVIIKSNSVDEIDITVDTALEYTANISLPSDYDIDENVINGKVYLQMAHSPYHILDVAQFTLDKNCQNVSVDLYDDMNSKKVICYYVLSGAHKGLFDFGHYSTDGTTFDIDKSDKLRGESTVDIPLLRTKEINVNFTLPDNDVAEEGVRINVSPIFYQGPLSIGPVVVDTPSIKVDEGDEVVKIDHPTESDKLVDYPTISEGDIFALTPIEGKSIEKIVTLASSGSGGASSGGAPGGGGGGSVSYPVIVAPPTIAIGEKSGQGIVAIPDEDGYSYVLKIKVDGGADKYYSTVYYNKLKTTTKINHANTVDNSVDNINVTLIRQYFISGIIDAVGFENSHNRITVASQTSDSIIKDIYDCDFKVYTDIYGVGNYGVYVPADYDKYILQLNSFVTGRTIYYSPDECVDELSKAKVLTVNQDMNDVDFKYSGYNPSIPLEIDAVRNSGEWKVRLRNIGDFDTNAIDLYISFYDKNGAMKNLIRESAGIIEARSTNEIYVTVPESYLQGVETIKVMAWDNLKPMANVVELVNTSVNEKMIASAYMQVGETTVYHHGEEHIVDVAPTMVDGVLYAPVRAIAETLGWTVNSLQGDEETIKITDQNGYVIILTENEFKAKADGVTVSLNNPPIVIDSRMMLPFENIASYMGYECVQNDNFGTVAVYDSIDWKVKYAIENNMMPEILKSRFVTERLSRKQLAAIIVNAYETINYETIPIDRKPFSDCDDENVLKACSLGIISGFEDSTFKPELSLTRAEYSKVMFSLLNLLGLDVQFDKENTTDYTDITDLHWASGYVYGLNAIGIFDGIFEGLFKPENSITIREALAILGNGYKELKQSEYTDIPNTHPYILAITNVSNKRIMVGYEDGTFMPDHCVMRSEFTALITRMDGQDIRQSETFSCADVTQNHWASGCIEYCINNGIISLENDKFRPDVEITIGETIDALMNYLGFAPDLDIQEKLIQAEKIGLLNGVVAEIAIDEPCLRGMMAQLINNTLNIDMENL